MCAWRALSAAVSERERERERVFVIPYSWGTDERLSTISSKKPKKTKKKSVAKQLVKLGGGEYYSGGA